MESKLKKELDQMKKQGITGKPKGPTEWSNDLVIKKSDDRWHICLDLKYLNQAITWEHHTNT